MKTIVVNVTGDGLADYIQANASTIEFAFSSEPPTQNGFDTVLINDPNIPGGVEENLVPHMEGGESGDGIDTAEDVFKNAIKKSLYDGAEAQGVTLTADQTGSMADITLFTYAPGYSNDKIYDALYKKITEGVRDNDVVNSMVSWCRNDLRLLSYRLDASTGDFDALSVNTAMEPTDDDGNPVEIETEDTPLPALNDLDYRSVTVSFTMPNYDPNDLGDDYEASEGRKAYVRAVEDALENAVPSAFSDFKAVYICKETEIFCQVEGVKERGIMPTLDEDKIPAPGESGSVSINCGYGEWDDMAFIFFPVLEDAEPSIEDDRAYIRNPRATYEGLWSVIQSGGQVWKYLATML